MQGRAVLLNFQISWCEPCRAEIPTLQQVADLYRPDKLLAPVFTGLQQYLQPEFPDQRVVCLAQGIPKPATIKLFVILLLFGVSCAPFIFEICSGRC